MIDLEQVLKQPKDMKKYNYLNDYLNPEPTFTVSNLKLILDAIYKYQNESSKTILLELSKLNTKIDIIKSNQDRLISLVHKDTNG